MKKLLLVLSVAVAFASTFSASCLALADEVSSVRISVAKKTGGFIAGVASGLVFHELGHEAMARFEGVDMRWSGTTNWRTSASPAAMRNIAIGGFGAQVLSTEIMLGVDAIPKDNAFILGWLAFNVLNVANYMIKDEVCGGYGDFETLRNNGMNTDFLKVGLLAHAALSAYRLYKNPKFIPYVGMARDELVLGLTWRW